MGKGSKSASSSGHGSAHSTAHGARVDAHDVAAAHLVSVAEQRRRVMAELQTVSLDEDTFRSLAPAEVVCKVCAATWRFHEGSPYTPATFYCYFYDDRMNCRGNNCGVCGVLSLVDGGGGSSPCTAGCCLESALEAVMAGQAAASKDATKAATE